MSDAFNSPIPHDITAEQAVLGACLTDELSLRRAARILTAEDFYRPAHEVIWGTMHLLLRGGGSVDAVTVHDELRRTSQLQQAGGAPYIHELFAKAPFVDHLDQHSKIVRELATRRKVIQAAQRLIQRASSGESDAGTLAADAVRSLSDVRDRGDVEGEEVRWLAEVLEEPDSYDWLVPNLLEHGDRLVIVAAEGSGKTTLIRQMIVCLASGLQPFTLAHHGPGVNVLAVDSENSEATWRREIRPMVKVAEQLTGTDPTWKIGLRTARRLDITSDRDLALVHHLIDRSDARVLAIGPLYKLVRKAVYDDDTAVPLLAALDTFRDRGVTIVMEAHAGHGHNSEGHRDMRPRGSSALLGWPEFGIGMRLKKPEIEGALPTHSILTRWRGDRDQGRAWPTELRRGGRMPFVDEYAWTARAALSSPH